MAGKKKSDCGSENIEKAVLSNNIEAIKNLKNVESTYTSSIIEV